MTIAHALNSSTTVLQQENVKLYDYANQQNPILYVYSYSIESSEYVLITITIPSTFKAKIHPLML